MQLLRQELGQGHKGSFGDGVVSDDGGQVVGCVASKDDDGAVLMLPEMGKRFLDEEESALEVDVPHLLDLVLLGLEEVTHLGGDSRIGHQVINGPVLIDGFLDQLLPVFFLADVANNPMRFVSLLLELVDSLIDVLLITTGDDDLHALFGQILGDALPDARGGGGDDCDLALHDILIYKRDKM